MAGKSKRTPARKPQKKRRSKPVKAKLRVMHTTGTKPTRDQVVNAATHKNSSLRTFMDGFSSQEKELLVTSTVFKDYETTTDKSVMVLAFSGLQSMFGGIDNISVSRIKSLKVWALPRAANAQVADSSFIVLYGTPIAGSDDSSHALASQRSTIVNPTFDVKWTMVGKTDFDATFDSSILTPVTNSGNPVYVVAKLQVINPDDGTPLNQKIQLMFQIQYYCTLPLKTELKYSTTFNESFQFPVANAVSEQYAMTKLDKLTNML